MKYLKRTEYIEKLKCCKNNRKLKIVNGIYGSGKSNLIFYYVNELLHEDEDAHIIYIDYSLPCYDDLKSHNDLYNHVTDNYQLGKKNYLFIDEVQLCPEFYFAINRIFLSGKFDIYLICSISAFNDLETGEFPKEELNIITVYPFSFREYCEYNEDFDDIEVLYEWYLMNGGFPGAVRISDKFERKEYINRLYLNITGYGLNDRYHVQDGRVLEKIQKYMIDNISRPTSPNKLSDSLKSSGFNTNHVTTGRYIRHLINAHVFFELKRKDLRSETILETMVKYYLADLSLIERSKVKCNPGSGQILENLVFLELKRRGFELFTGKIYKNEIDFVAEKDGERIYIQIISDIHDEATFKDALKPLIQVKDASPKIAVCRSKNKEYYVSGVKIIDIAEWLYGDQIY